MKNPTQQSVLHKLELKKWWRQMNTKSTMMQTNHRAGSVECFANKLR